MAKKPKTPENLCLHCGSEDVYYKWRDQWECGGCGRTYNFPPPTDRGKQEMRAREVLSRLEGVTPENRKRQLDGALFLQMAIVADKVEQLIEGVEARK